MTSPSADLTISVEISGLIKAIQKHGSVRTVQAHLERLTKNEKALHVVKMLNLHQQQGEVLAGIVTHMWENYVIPEKLWEHYEGGESRFKEDVAYKEFIVPALEYAKASQTRKDRHTSRLESKWGLDWKKEISLSSDHPSILSEHYLRNMAKLASSGMALMDAKLLLHQAMENRISNPGKGVRTQQILMVTDIQKVVSAISAVSHISNTETEPFTQRQVVTCLNSSASSGPSRPDLDLPRITHDALTPGISPHSTRKLFAVEVNHVLYLLYWRDC